jgi:hypothetical protein
MGTAIFGIEMVVVLWMGTEAVLELAVAIRIVT